MKKIVGLDALRAIAVLVVIRSHWGPGSFKHFPIFTSIYDKVMPVGIFGVDFFFVLSGFLITAILLRAREAAAGKNRLQALKTFVIRRALRIFPIYYLCLLFLIAINYPDVRENWVWFFTYTANFLFFITSSLRSLGHMWSLSVEEQFYLIWPFAIIFLPKKFLPYMILLVVVASTAIACVTRHLHDYFGYFLTFNCLHVFGIGGLYAYALTDNANGKKITKTFRILLPVAAVVYIVSVFDVDVGVIHLVHAVLSVNLIMYICEKRYGKFTAIIVENKVLNSLGKISYGLYLYHYMMPALYYYFVANVHIGSKLYRFLYAPLIAEAAQMLLLLIISYASFYLIEVNVLKLKKRFKYAEA